MYDTGFIRVENVYDEQNFVMFPHIFYLDTVDRIGNKTLRWVK
jgi:hypothetical protein